MGRKSISCTRTSRSKTETVEILRTPPKQELYKRSQSKVHRFSCWQHGLAPEQLVAPSARSVVFGGWDYGENETSRLYLAFRF